MLVFLVFVGVGAGRGALELGLVGGEVGFDNEAVLETKVARGDPSLDGSSLQGEGNGCHPKLGVQQLVGLVHHEGVVVDADVEGGLLADLDRAFNVVVDEDGVGKAGTASPRRAQLHQRPSRQTRTRWRTCRPWAGTRSRSCICQTPGRHRTRRR